MLCPGRPHLEQVRTGEPGRYRSAVWRLPTKSITLDRDFAHMAQSVYVWPRLTDLYSEAGPPSHQSVSLSQAFGLIPLRDGRPRGLEVCGEGVLRRLVTGMPAVCAEELFL